MNRYLTEKVTAVEPLGGWELRVTFADGFTRAIDLSPLIGKGPIFDPLRDPAFFRKASVVRGALQWSDDLDLCPGALRAWCEAGRFMDYPETDAWIEEHSHPAQTVA